MSRLAFSLVAPPLPQIGIDVKRSGLEVMCAFIGENRQEQASEDNEGKLRKIYTMNLYKYFLPNTWISRRLLLHIDVI